MMIRVVESTIGNYQDVGELERLAFQYQDGDSNALDILLHRMTDLGHRREIIAFNRGRFNRTISDDDILSEYHIKLEEAARTVKTSFLPLLRTIVYFGLLNGIIKSNKEPKNFSDIGDDYSGDDSQNGSCKPLDTDELDLNEIIKEFNEEISPRDKKVIYLRLGLGLSYREIGEKLGVHNSTARKYFNKISPELIAKLVIRGFSNPNDRKVTRSLAHTYEINPVEPGNYRSLNKRKELERKIRENLVNTPEFMEKSISLLILQYQSGDNKALNSVHSLTQGLKIDVAGMRKYRCDSRVHINDIETDVSDGVTIVANKYDFSDISQGSLYEFTLRVMQKNCRWLKKIYPFLRYGYDSKRNDINEVVNKPNFMNLAEEVEYADYVVNKTFEQLKPRDLEIFRRRLVLGESVEDIADNIGCNTGVCYRTMEKIKKVASSIAYDEPLRYSGFFLKSTFKYFKEHKITLPKKVA